MVPVLVDVLLLGRGVRAQLVRIVFALVRGRQEKLLRIGIEFIVVVGIVVVVVVITVGCLVSTGRWFVLGQVLQGNESIVDVGEQIDAAFENIGVKERQTADARRGQQQRWFRSRWIVKQRSLVRPS